MNKAKAVLPLIEEGCFCLLLTPRNTCGPIFRAVMMKKASEATIASLLPPSVTPVAGGGSHGPDNQEGAGGVLEEAPQGEAAG
ncbi:hypothetical protein [Paenibacillus antibioticophila]|uniref:hypothetical protein n=1 Tax=Paenibacillus antibioticophila TaxID=1274374 RepID=UPI001CA336A7|nr:hypothetical protein [Paenibacillus antibioticophila]